MDKLDNFLEISIGDGDVVGNLVRAFARSAAKEAIMGHSAILSMAQFAVGFWRWSA